MNRPAYEDLELHPFKRDSGSNMSVSVPAGTAVRTALWILATAIRYPGRVITFEMGTTGSSYVEAEPNAAEELARHSHLGAIVIVAAIVGLALIAVALFVRGAS